MINVMYFAAVREALGVAYSNHELAEPCSVEQLVDTLRGQGGRWESALSGQLLCSINQEMVQLDTLLNDGDELALFPPVTGG